MNNIFEFLKVVIFKKFSKIQWRYEIIKVKIDFSQIGEIFLEISEFYFVIQ